MIRKTTFALATIAALASAALAPTSASAHFGGGHFGHFGGHGFGRWGAFGIGAGIAGALAVDSCWRPVVVNTPVGPVVRDAYVCY